MSYELLVFQAGMRKNANIIFPFQPETPITHNS